MGIRRFFAGIWRFFGRSDQRRARRHRVPTLRVTIDGHSYRTRDWSMTGFRLGECQQSLKPGDRVSGSLHLPGRGGTGEFAADVVWLSPQGEVGLMLKEITPRLLVAMGGIAGH